MSERLDIGNIMSVHPEFKHLPEGDQVHVNHPNCPAGRDTKKRLYVKKDEGKLLFYCHHCQRSNSTMTKRRHIRDSKNVVSYSDIHLPPDLTTVPKDMNVHGTAWLSKYDITELECKHYMLGWSDRENRIILPVYDWQRMYLLAYQRRHILPHDELPKYLTTRRADTKHPVWYGSNHREADTIVITEDILSAIKVNRTHMSMALLGTHMPDAALYWIADNYKHAVLWLDNDGVAVRQQQRNILKRLSTFFMGTAVILTTECDPKELDHHAIRTLVDSA